MDAQHWIFLSPHLDDGALSCGGLLWDLAQNGHQVEIWTMMAGDPPDENYSPFAQQNHLAWDMTGAEAAAMRRAEDQQACEVLGVGYRHFDWPDAIYRRDQETGEPVVNNNSELFGKPPEKPLVSEISHLLTTQLPHDSVLVSPMGLGMHIDHLAVKLAAKATGRVNYFYADYPYILKDFPSLNQGWQPVSNPFDQAALQTWQEAVLAYRSQLSGFWRDDVEAVLCLRNYMAGGGGRLWQRSYNVHRSIKHTIG